ncbi:MAG: hypothetical protein Q9167_005282 [Letrouitia subvulpina]
MSPLLRLCPRNVQNAGTISSQWRTPNDILSLLLLVGGDIVRCALAQQTGDTLPTPVVFSFGWVAYAFTAVLRQSLESMLEREKRPKAGLCISVFEASPDALAGVPKRDMYWYSGYFVAILQLAVAAVPWGVWGAWEVFVVTFSGTILSFGMGSLPRWRQERWNCRRNSKKASILTQGNGAQHALVILGKGHGLDLEDLAASNGVAGALGSARVILLLLALAWIVLLITVSGIKEQTWFLVAVGMIGMLQNVIITGAPRKPEWFGIHLQYRSVFVQSRVIDTIKSAEEQYPGLEKAMLPIFFPGGVAKENSASTDNLSANENAPSEKQNLENNGKGNPDIELDRDLAFHGVLHHHGEAYPR